MNYTIESIADFCAGKSQIAFLGSTVSRINIDHRSAKRDNALFAAIIGSRFDGHDFIPELLELKYHHFLVTDERVAKRYEGRANFIIVKDMIPALQLIAKEHRDNYLLPVLAITGSNGKTIVKEWLNSLLESEFKICRSPKSYNSQIGVPLSVFELSSYDSLAIFEAGISLPTEMERLEQILKPTIGLITNIGDAHSAHFDSDQAKFLEKWKLFMTAKKVLVCKDQTWTKWIPKDDIEKCVFWSKEDKSADIYFSSIKQQSHSTLFKAIAEGKNYSFEIPFTDRISIENAGHCFAMCIILGKINSRVLSKFEDLSPIAMRMEVKQGLEDSLIIDDTYNSDLGSLQASVDQLMTHADRDKYVILSDLEQNADNHESYVQIAHMLREAEVTHLIAIGSEIAKNKDAFEPILVRHFDSGDEFWEQLDTKTLRHKAILIKGARKFKLEKLVTRLQAKQRITTLEIDLRKLRQNLTYFRGKIKESTKVMVMVKAFAYGSGSYEVAHFFQSRKIVNYLVVAYADEGVTLRKKGISLPIMVMSPSKTAYESMIQHNLEPEIYSLNTLKDFIRATKTMRHFFDEYSIHLKIDSGMHRLGFEEDELREALLLIKEIGFLRVATVFTHLSATDDEAQDDFTRQQIDLFLSVNQIVVDSLGYQPDRHTLNSTGVLRFPEYHFEMVRLGIGLYGFSDSDDSRFLHALGSLKSYIVQIREVRAGDSVGYARKGVGQVDRRIATVALGYADGLDRRLSNGNWQIEWQGVKCPTVGNICMDMTMIDVSLTEAKEGDEVVIFSGNSDIQKMADKLGTIPYEILTKIPERVRRIYLQE
ncbi:bifunctional UDP-N-acetylmuramoyl-tripeptide:D-alanyl-D-alanine ligase/alanine racemase [Salibacteraceae bacterium]|jgi:Alr-MurF fusion protein|nr:bifunctional UDP-N-acetylmuramoyl-tripeptide:D-alanyl-D-alanine ligase/alanine racemase [Salibacteraceae bacterium]MDB9710220.1 bifunctional UDP-N-acetylmuramoyl-tripeptide:D-alanyl-D-alanine ligase/alanine racemase [Salibacteraceae bacterium]MDC1304346.1 bifunctional UDP-N-acetylmuramoyl-tripeptide:D-alanyl-D-alanine ligase/alanine racemase [Salibacteraceae bacterium]HAQ69668.1 bifunctional UDP-N-acetylmuramoyl-tripeptide:D-alanyl-D-alanine ligase/alanine racemase [Flavobacteriales bacterium